MKNRIHILATSVIATGLLIVNTASPIYSVKTKIQKTSQNANDDQKIIQEYHDWTYDRIFTDKLNPGSKGNNKGEVTYWCTGSYSSPTWGKLKYRFSSGYVYLLYKMIAQKDYFYDTIINWLRSTKELSNNLKINIILDIFLNYIDINNTHSYREFFEAYKTRTDIERFINYLNSYRTSKYIPDQEIVRGSLINVIKSMNKNSFTAWANNYIYEPYTINGYDIAYDGGLNFFIYYHSNNLKKFAQLLDRGSCYGCKNSREIFWCQREFSSERTSGGSNYLSYALDRTGNGYLVTEYYYPK